MQPERCLAIQADTLALLGSASDVMQDDARTQAHSDAHPRLDVPSLPQNLRFVKCSVGHAWLVNDLNVVFVDILLHTEDGHTFPSGLGYQ